MNEEKEQETQSDFDVAAGAAEISEELFGQAGSDEGTDETAGGQEDKSSGSTETADVAEPPAQTSSEPVVNSQAVQDVGAPKTWTKEALEDWAKIPSRAQQEILKREEDMMRGINAYREAADLGARYSKVVEPYAPILAAENIDPVGLFQSFAANHYLLSRGTPAQKLELTARLFESYNIPLKDFLEYIAGQGEPQDPRLAAYDRRFQELENRLSSAQNQEIERRRAVARSQIDAFADDGNHPLFDELADDINKIINAGAATSLQDAYDRALWGRPDLREKEIERLTAEKLSAQKDEAAKKAAKRQRAMGDHVDVTSKSRNGTVPKGSMDDTLEETMAAIQERG
jgi:hypothetical protein